MEAIRYTAGSDIALRYRFCLDLFGARIDDQRSALLTRFVEFWCQKNCKGEWQVVDTGRVLIVSFDIPRDGVLFKMADEFDHDSRFVTYLDVKPDVALLGLS